MEDLVKREKIFEHIKAVCLEGDGGALITSEDFLKMAIKDIPSAEPKRLEITPEDLERLQGLGYAVEPKQGEWIKSKAHASMWECSECDWGTQDCYDYNYCPYCGARMKGADNE